LILREGCLGTMNRRIVHVVIAAAVGCLMLTGCLLNTPERVVKRFVTRLKGRRWDGMAELIDWPQSSRYVQGVPAVNRGEEDAKREVMKRIAENLTGFPVRERTPDQTRHEFIYLKLASMERINSREDWVWLKVRVSTEKRAKTVKVLVMKIRRVWRIALTDSIFE
jgi:hypothetical protein